MSDELKLLCRVGGYCFVSEQCENDPLREVSSSGFEEASSPIGNARTWLLIQAIRCSVILRIRCRAAVCIVKVKT